MVPYLCSPAVRRGGDQQRLAPDGPLRHHVRHGPYSADCRLRDRAVSGAGRAYRRGRTPVPEISGPDQGPVRANQAPASRTPGTGRPAAGGLLLAMPDVAGNGYSVVHSLLTMHWTWYAEIGRAHV